MKRDTDLDVSRHYFESSHGKSAADGLASIVKHSATTAVTRGQTRIQNGIEFHSYCVDNLQQVGNSVYPSRVEAYKSASRKFIYVEDTEITRDRPDREVRSVKGTMKIHPIVPTGVSYELKTRNLSCFCNFCYHHVHAQGQCTNISIVGKWSPCTLKPIARSSSDIILYSMGITCLIRTINNMHASCSKSTKSSSKTVNTYM